MVNAALRDPLFWQQYYRRDSDDFCEDAAACQLEALAKDFVVETDEEAESSVVHFGLPFGDASEMRVAYTMDAFMTSMELSLRDVASGKDEEMGWWDDARWHPYCIRPEELDLLERHWARRGQDVQVGLLLLAPFIGLGDEAARDAMSSRVNAAYRVLCPDVGDHPPLSLHICEDYRWSRDEELGWLFSGEYPCYSLRNRAHVGGEEGRFPFARFNSVMSGLAAQD
jgi:hypothetical protein